MRRKVLTYREIREARELKKVGYSKRELARIFEVGDTTIHNHVFKERRPFTRIYLPKRHFRSVPSVVEVVTALRHAGLNSLQIAEHLDLPLIEVNYIFGKYA